MEYEAKKSLAKVFLIGIIMSAIFVVLGVVVHSACFALLIVSLGYTIILCLKLGSIKMQFYKDKVVISGGVLSHSEGQEPLIGVSSISVRQSFLGGLLNYGTVTVIFTGQKFLCFAEIKNPLELKYYLEQKLVKKSEVSQVGLI